MPQKNQDQVLAETGAAVSEIIENNHKAAGFKVGDFVRSGGVKMPEADVIVFTDVQAGYEEQQARFAWEDLQNAADTAGHAFGPPEEEQTAINEAKAEHERLAKQIWDTRLVFHLRGLAPKLVLAINNKGAAKDKARGDLGPSDYPWADVEMFRKSVVYVQLADTDQIDTWEQDENSDQAWEDAKAVLESLYFPEAQKLRAMVDILAMSVEMSDRRSDAGFPGGSVEPSGEPGVVVPDSDSGGAEPAAG